MNKTDSDDTEANGDDAAACKILRALCQADLRCLDAHAHLGNWIFDNRPKHAIRDYADFDGLLPWGHIDNRPFLRCLHGLGLCLWRLGRFQEAERVFDRMLWFNPAGSQGARVLVDEVRAKIAWQDQGRV